MADLQRVLQSEAASAADPAGPRVVDLFNIPERYVRSVHLEQDFDDIASLKHYVITQPMAAILSRIIEGLRPGSGHRAWRITGDYGTGKSSFALVLAHLLRDPMASVLAPVRGMLGQDIQEELVGITPIRMVPVLVTGAREPLVPAVARAIGRTADRLAGKSKRNRALRDLRNLATAVAKAGDTTQLLDLLDRLANCASPGARSGVLLVLDELGKFLEYSALHTERDDIYVLQRLAEAAARSGDQPLVILGLLHQGFHAYAERLPTSARREWEKVSGRYEEITFDQPLTQIAALVKGALGVDRTRLPPEALASAEHVRAASETAGWYRPSGSVPSIDLYPLHPLVLPVLVRFFARFGQHERSLFSFLLSSEPFGLQWFAEQYAVGDKWYRLSDFYDYVRSVFGHRLAGASYRNHWLRISETLDRTMDISALELRILKAAAVLNVLDAEYLLPTDEVLTASISDDDQDNQAKSALVSLTARGMLFHRGLAGGYCLWPSTSVNLEQAFDIAQRTLGPVARVSGLLKPYLPENPVLARRHYIETGTMRHFDLRYAEYATRSQIVAQATNSDGQIFIILCDSEADRKAVIEYVSSNELATRPDLLLGVIPPLEGLRAELQDARCWQWVADNTPELSEDPYGSAEVSRQVASARLVLVRRLRSLTSEVQWWRRGSPFQMPEHGTLSAALSQICDALYDRAPRISNELLNRRTLSSAAAAARQRLIDRMFSASEEAALGIPAGKAPPEKSMYLSVLRAGNVHREEAGRHVIAEPPADDDPLFLRPALDRIMELLEPSDGHRVSVMEILRTINNPPYGVRAGVAPLLLAILVIAHVHELAVYENGTFVQRVGPADFLRLTKQPAGFEFQLCRVAGVRAEVFVQLAQVFAADRLTSREPELLDVVRPLSTFAASLPEYTRKASNLSDIARNVRDALLHAREPGPLLFSDLPVACGFAPFVEEGSRDGKHAREFVTALRGALNDLRDTYPLLLARIRTHLSGSLAEEKMHEERDFLARRAARVALAAREPRLQTFARCLADVVLPEDAWTEKLCSFVVAKPPSRWTLLDEVRARDEIEVLSGTFLRVEATAFAVGDAALDQAAIRLGITQATGSEAARVIRIRPDDELAVQQLTAKIAILLGEVTEIELAALSRVLWRSLAGSDPITTAESTSTLEDAR